MNRFLVLTLAFVMLAPMSAIYATESSTSMTQKKTPKQNGRYKTVVYKVSLDCESCKEKLVENISFEKGVRALSISLQEQTVKVTYDARKTDSLTIEKAINKLGYKIEK